MFKVVPDQLRISDGWVRCGQCDEVFDASLHLMPVSVDGGLLVAQQDVQEEYPVISDSSEVDLDLDYLGSQPNSSEAIDEPEPPDSHFEAKQEDATIVLPMDLTREPEAEAFDFNVSFLHDKRATTYWQQPLMRVVLAVLALTSILLLFGQIVFHERDRVAALYPGLKPWLVTFCKPLNCTVAPVQKIDAIVIDSSSFTKSKGNAYQLNFTVKNTAITAVSLPAIELTLTDSLNQVVLQRVFLPSELKAKSDALLAGAEWSVSLAMAVSSATLAERVAGYRLIAFYP
jgi:predicted Zn finger-like uncharacterized protein